MSEVGLNRESSHVTGACLHSSKCKVSAKSKVADSVGGQSVEEALRREQAVLKGLPVQVGDTVIRKGVPGPRGIVDGIRVETTRPTLRQEEGEPPGVTVSVLWDNGTTSHFVPNGVEVVSPGKAGA